MIFHSPFYQIGGGEESRKETKYSKIKRVKSNIFTTMIYFSLNTLVTRNCPLKTN